MDEISGFNVDCSLCGTDLSIAALAPVQLEHVLDIWHRAHAHTVAERAAWYRSITEDVPSEDAEED